MIPRHPFGDPQTVEISASDGTVQVHWEVGGQDDLTLLAIHLGVLPEDRIMLDGAIVYDEGDGDLLAEAPELEDYLLDHIGVSAGDQACAGEVTTVGDLTADEGADLSFTCPVDAATATVTVTMLTDLHPAYRTLATGPDGQRAAYSRTQDSHEWTLPVTAGAAATTSGTSTPTGPSATPAGGGDLGQSAALQMGGVGAVLLVLVGGAVALRRRSHRTTTPSTPEKGDVRVGKTPARQEVP